MKILYGVAGDGYGHASHADSIAKSLIKNGHEILIITSGRAYAHLKDKFKTYHIQGIYLGINNGKVDPIKTLLQNFKDFPKNLPRFHKLKKILKKFNPELIITDYEPVTSYISLFLNKPLISISNQDRFLNFDLPLKQYSIDYMLIKLVSRFITPLANYRIATTVLPIYSTKKNVFISSPIIRPEVRKLKTKKEDKIIVYSHRKDKKFLNALKDINENFIVFGYNINKKVKNIHFKKKEDFAKEFAHSKAIISTSGFVSVGEAVFLKKPYLAIPQIGQYEQIYNATIIDKLKIGKYNKKISKTAIINFLNNLNTYQKNLNKLKINEIKAKDIINSIIQSLS